MGMSGPRATKSRRVCWRSMTSRLVLLVAMVLAIAGAGPGSARADWDDRPDPGEFEQALSPSGYWIDDAQFGRVWRPYVDWGWQPYVDGRWAWTSYGWTWISGEPWGWTFHYGRWGFSNLYGWVWTPGVVWGPAWVDWYWGDGYVGWAPLGPQGFVVVPNYWTYVYDHSFCSPHVNDVVVGHDQLPSYIVHHREHGWGRAHAPDLHDIEHVSRHGIDRIDQRPESTIAPWVRHRIEQGERVRERVVDRGQERVIEHGGRTVLDNRARSGRPVVADDGGYAPAPAHPAPGGHTIDHGRSGSDGTVVYGRPPTPADGGTSRPPIDDGHMVLPPRHSVEQGGGWGHPPARGPATVTAPPPSRVPDPHQRDLGRPVPPPQAYQGGRAPVPLNQQPIPGAAGPGAPMVHAPTSGVGWARPAPAPAGGSPTRRGGSTASGGDIGHTVP